MISKWSSCKYKVSENKFNTYLYNDVFCTRIGTNIYIYVSTFYYANFDKLISYIINIATVASN